MNITSFIISSQAIRDRIIKKAGLDTGVLVAFIDNNMLLLSKPQIYIKKGMCYTYKLVVDQTIGVLISKRHYSREDAISQTLSFLRDNNIEIIRDEAIDTAKRDELYNDLIKQRNKLKTKPLPEDSDLDILASYKVAGIDLIFTTNVKHFFELGKYLEVYIEGVYSEKQNNVKEAEKMFRDLFWKRNKKFKRN